MPSIDPPNPLQKAFVIRPGRLSDLDQIGAIGSRVFTHAFSHAVSPSSLQTYLASAYGPSAIAADFANPLMDFIVASDDGETSNTDAGADNVDTLATGRIVGFAQLTRGTSDPSLAGYDAPVELQRLYVDLDCHGRGIGTRLAEAAEELARREGFRTMWLGVWEENVKAQRLYARLGFEKIGSHEFRMGSDVHFDWLMAKSLWISLPPRDKQES